jgi:hypothetical protein
VVDLCCSRSHPDSVALFSLSFLGGFGIRKDYPDLLILVVFAVVVLGHQEVLCGRVIALDKDEASKEESDVQDPVKGDSDRRIPGKPAHATCQSAK